MNQNNNPNQRNNQGKNNSKSLNKGPYSGNGYNPHNNYKKNGTNSNDNSIAQALEKAKQKRKRASARNAIRTGLNSVAPGTGEIANQMLKTEKGEELIDAYNEAENPTQGLKNVANKIKEQSNRRKMILFIAPLMGFILIFALLILLFFKNADSQIYSNENDGKVNPEQYPDNDSINPNIFVKYPGIYQKIEQAAQKVGSKYKVDIDRYLILATLIAPIENQSIIPISDNSCGETDCYYLEGKSYTWEEFLEVWGDQAEYLAKAQILTYVNPSSKLGVSCGQEKTVEQFAKNDLEVNEFKHWWDILNPVNWFKGFRNRAEAEINAKCIMDVPVGESSIPTVYVLSKEQGKYYTSINANHEIVYEKDPSTGGVYFWNLANEGGFIHVYMKDYLNVKGNASDKEVYEQNLATILDITNYIYSYYESIRKDCNGRLLIESSIENVKVSDRKGGYYEVSFDQYIGGVILAEIGNAPNIENQKAFAVLARSYALSIIGLDGRGVILNSSANQNYNPSYSPERFPLIAEAVEATKGLVVSNYGSSSVLRTVYDAFCPTTRLPQNGFYYLSYAQKSLPINPAAYEKKTHTEFKINPEYTACPCYPSKEDRPGHGQGVYIGSSTQAPTGSYGNPSQTTPAVCWTYTGQTRLNKLTGNTEYHWSYHHTGGHGNGASQYGLRYYSEFGYEWEALIKLFFPDGTIKRLSSSVEDGECDNASIYEGGTSTTIDSCGVSFDVSDSNYTKRVSGNPLNSPLLSALSNSGYSVECLNSCISQRVTAAGIGTREGVVEAAMGLLECTMEMTGGFTYPYDHRGGYTPRNPDINGRLGINSRWGEYEDWATGCGSSNCRLGLNCANFVRWSLCNGGMNFCTSRAHDTFATGIAGVNTSAQDYFPGAIRIFISGNSFSTVPNITIGELSTGYQNELGSIYQSSQYLSQVHLDKVLSLIKPGDVLYSDVNGGSNHVMVIVGKEDSAIWIAENGRKTRMITYDELKSGSKNYVVLLLDAFYEDANNRNNLSW